MRRLLQLSQDEIGLRSRSSSPTTPLKTFLVIKFFVRTMKFLLGEYFAEALRSLIFSMLRGWRRSRKHGPEQERQYETAERNFPML